MTTTFSKDDRKGPNAILWIILGLTIASAAATFYYRSFHQFQRTLVTSSQNQRKIITQTMRDLIMNHIEEAHQNLEHTIGMIRTSGGGIEEASVNLDMMLISHEDEFQSLAIIEGNRILYSAPSSLSRKSEESILQYLTADSLPTSFISGRSIVGDLASSYLFVPFTIPGDEHRYQIVGSLNLRSFAKQHLKRWEEQDLCFLLADYLGDIYVISNIDHKRHGIMEKGNIFNLAGEICVECHQKADFVDVRQAVERTEIIHSVRVSPDGNKKNRSSLPFSLFGETWVISVCSPYDQVQGAISSSFLKNIFLSLATLILIGTFGFFSYRSEKKKAVLEERARSEEKLRILLDNVPAAIYESTIEGKLLNVNAYMVRLLGYDSVEELKGLSALSLYQDPRDREKFIEDTFKSGTVRDRVMPFLKKNGEPFLVSCSASGLFDKKGNLLSIRGYFQDLTEEMKAEENRKSSEERYRALFDSAGDGIFTLKSTESELELTTANSSGLKMLGLGSGDELTDKTLLDFSPPFQGDGRPSAAMISGIFSAVVQGTSRSFEWVLLRSDDTEITCEMHLNLIQVGGRRFLQAVARDITARKKADLDRLRIDKLRSISTLAGGIAHDFNNILAGIVGNIGLAKLLLESKPDNFIELSSALNAAEKACDRASSLTNKMLAFSRKSNEPYRRKVENFEEIVREDSEMALHGSNVAARYHFAEDCHSPYADPVQIGQVVHNLVKNARESMPDGGLVHVSVENETVRSHTVLEAGEYVRIRIRDEGEGILKDRLDKIFDAYYTTKEEGQGLGLASAYSIVKQHQGHIEAESTADKGSLFTFYLPTAPISAESSQSLVLEEKIRGNGERILIIDDETAVGDVMLRILGNLGYDVSFYSSSQEGIDSYRQAMQSGTAFDLVITDLTLPNDRSGLQIKEEIRELNPDAKVILTSGYLQHPIMSHYEKHCFDATIPKPVRASTLSTTVGSLFKKARA